MARGYTLFSVPSSELIYPFSKQGNLSIRRMLNSETNTRFPLLKFTRRLIENFLCIMGW